ncbi:MAG TPA: GNAT family N-acetyltransferase [Candidatus Limnocylindrales bacterium]
MNGITVREARPNELDAAGSLVADAYLAQGGVDALDPGYLDLIRDARARSAACPILVAVEEGSGTVLGSVSYVSGEGNPFAEVERDGEAGFRMLGVAPRAQGRGVGEALVRACIERARADARSGIAISTTLDSFAAHRLYERLGFRRDPDRDFDPVPGIHLIAYVLGL